MQAKNKGGRPTRTQNHEIEEKAETRGIPWEGIKEMVIEKG